MLRIVLSLNFISNLPSFYDVLQIKIGATVIKTVGGYLSLADILLTDDELIALYGLCSSSEATKTITHHHIL